MNFSLQDEISLTSLHACVLCCFVLAFAHSYTLVQVLQLALLISHFFHNFTNKIFGRYICDVVTEQMSTICVLTAFDSVPIEFDSVPSAFDSEPTAFNSVPI